jgi:mono/diheme cytochrome c family protein
MARWWVLLGLGTSLALGLTMTSPIFDASAQTDSAASDSATPDAAMIARGEYLVQHVAMCVQCHSARTDDGEIVPETMLHGAIMPVDPPSWKETWASKAPDIVTMARGRPDYVVSVLTIGRGTDGIPPESPMPPFRLKEADARAIVAYLTSLP